MQPDDLARSPGWPWAAFRLITLTKWGWSPQCSLIQSSTFGSTWVGSHVAPLNPMASKSGSHERLHSSTYECVFLVFGMVTDNNYYRSHMHAQPTKSNPTKRCNWNRKHAAHISNQASESGEFNIAPDMTRWWWEWQNKCNHGRNWFHHNPVYRNCSRPSLRNSDGQWTLQYYSPHNTGPQVFTSNATYDCSQKHILH
jgi:hypothetical protein